MKMKIMTVCIIIINIYWNVSIASPTANGLIPITWPEPQNIIFDEVEIYPGQKVVFTISGQVDLNHRYWRVRRCKYFGLKCWYENRESAGWNSYQNVAVNLNSNGNREHVVVKSEGKQINHSDVFFYKKGKSTIEYSLELLPKYDNGEKLTQGVKIYGNLPNNGIKGPSFVRTPCRGRPNVCSAGQLNFAISSIDNSNRLKYIKQYLNKNIKNMDIVSITDRNFFDYLLLDKEREINPNHINDLTLIAIEEMKQLLDGDNSRYAGNYIEIAKFILNLHPNNQNYISTLKIGILKALTIRGDWASAIAYAPKAVGQAKENYDVNNPTFQSACNYMSALKLNATVWREKNAKNSSDDISISVALIENAISVGKNTIKTIGKSYQKGDYCKVGNPHAPLNDVYSDIAELAIDGGRMMNLIRGEHGLKKAEEFLLEAKCFKGIVMNQVTDFTKCPKDAI